MELVHLSITKLELLGSDVALYGVRVEMLPILVPLKVNLTLEEPATACEHFVMSDVAEMIP